MKLSDKIQLYKDKGLSREVAFTKIKASVIKAGYEWSTKKQEIFDSIYPKSSIKLREHLQVLEDKFLSLRDNVDKSEAISFYFDVWKYFNTKYFDNKLPKPGFRFTRDTGQFFKVRAHYRPATNEFSFSKRLFNTSFKNFCVIFIHEMCHQAVHKIDHAVGYNLESGRRDVHGEPWKKWMRHCNLNPDIYDRTDLTEYFNEDEKQSIKETKDLIQKHQEEKKIKKCNVFEIAQYYKTKTKTWCRGILLCPDFTNKTRWVFLDIDSRSVMLLPVNLIFELQKEEYGGIDSPLNMTHAKSSLITYVKEHTPPASSSISKKENFILTLTNSYIGVIPKDRMMMLYNILYILFFTRASTGSGSFHLSELNKDLNARPENLIKSLHWFEEVDRRNHISFSTTAGLNSLSITPPSGSTKYTFVEFFIALNKMYLEV
jgi:hypothetical protein